jgi:MFS family permease
VVTRALRADEKRILALLGLPTLGLALSITVVSTYLPVVASDLGSSTTIIGLIIGGEGMMALFLPLWVGVWSDRLRTPIGGRLPFMLAATPPAAAALVLLGFADTLGLVAILVAVFFFGYFVAYEPYRALYPDLVTGDVIGRSQGNQALWRGGGTALAIVAGGLLFGLWQPAPFIGAAVILTAAVAVFSWGVIHKGGLTQLVAAEADDDDDDATLVERVRGVIQLVRARRELRLFFVANALWELALAALKTFVVLYITRGLGHGVAFASLVIGGVSLFLLGGAIVSGRLADQLGAGRVMEAALWIFGLGLLVPFAVTNEAIVAVSAPIIGFGGAVLMTLPFALLMPLMPDHHHGALTGYYSLSRGIGITLGPLVAGATIQAFSGIFTATDGYSAVWGVCALSVLVSIPLLRGLRTTAPEPVLRA